MKIHKLCLTAVIAGAGNAALARKASIPLLPKKANHGEDMQLRILRHKGKSGDKEEEEDRSCIPLDQSSSPTISKSKGGKGNNISSKGGSKGESKGRGKGDGGAKSRSKGGKSSMETPTFFCSEQSTVVPTDQPSLVPSSVPTNVPTEEPSSVPSDVPTELPSSAPTVSCHLLVDLRTNRQITITATTEPSFGTNSEGSSETGILLGHFFAEGGRDHFFSATTTSVHLHDFLGGPSGEPRILSLVDLAFVPSVRGLNLWNLSNAFTMNFQNGVQAFAGDTTFTVPQEFYNDAVASGSTGGVIYFPAEDESFIATATIVGNWCLVV